MVGVELARAGRHDEAIAHLREAARDFPRARFELGGELFNQGDIPAASLEVTRLLQLQPDDAVGHDMLGRALAAQGKLAEAQVEFERAVRIDPADDQARQDLEALRRALRGR